MDWLDEKIDKIQIGIKNLSLKKALALYIILCIIVIGILSAVTLVLIDRWDRYIWSQYYTAEPDNEMKAFYVYYEDESKLKDIDKVLVEVIDFIQTWSVFFYSIGGIIGVSYLFYNHKLKVPLRILKEATDQVGNNNLSMQIVYDNKDEMGDLCRSFDSMRLQLIENNQKMWDMMDEKRRLNAAFAHDLRTPLTVLRGYTDFLNQYVPIGKVPEEKLLITLSMMSGQLGRLERYSNTMKDIDSLEEILIQKQPTKLISLFDKLENMIEIMQGEPGKQIKLTKLTTDLEDTIYVDEAIFMEVFDNMISNALRYASQEVEVHLKYVKENNQLLLIIADDGKGFSNKDLKMAARPYYTGSEQKSEHFGIGLYICKLLCQKHGGAITLGNRINHGAIVTAAFSVAAILN